MWSVGGSVLGISGVFTKMGLRRHRVPTRRLLGSHTLGGIGVHLYVDFCRSLSGYQANIFPHTISLSRYNINIILMIPVTLVV